MAAFRALFCSSLLTAGVSVFATGASRLAAAFRTARAGGFLARLPFPAVRQALHKLLLGHGAVPESLTIFFRDLPYRDLACRFHCLLDHLLVFLQLFLQLGRCMLRRGMDRF